MIDESWFGGLLTVGQLSDDEKATYLRVVGDPDAPPAAEAAGRRRTWGKRGGRHGEVICMRCCGAGGGHRDAVARRHRLHMGERHPRLSQARAAQPLAVRLANGASQASRRTVRPDTDPGLVNDYQILAPRPDREDSASTWWRPLAAGSRVPRQRCKRARSSGLWSVRSAAAPSR